MRAIEIRPADTTADLLSMECVVCSESIDVDIWHSEVYVDGRATGFLVCDGCQQRGPLVLIGKLESWVEDVMPAPPH
jgi:hypothetical protein